MEGFKQFVYYEMKFDSRDEMLSFVSSELYRNGYVTEEYGSQIIARENKYPTGLVLDELNVAICHTEAKYVLKDGMFVLHLAEPITFKNAETLEDIRVSLVFGLVLTSGNKHMKILQRLSQLLLDNQNIRDLKNISSRETLQSFVFSHFGDLEVDYEDA